MSVLWNDVEWKKKVIKWLRMWRKTCIGSSFGETRDEAKEK